MRALDEGRAGSRACYGRVEERLERQKLDLLMRARARAKGA